MALASNDDLYSGNFDNITLPKQPKIEIANIEKKKELIETPKEDNDPF